MYLSSIQSSFAVCKSKLFPAMSAWITFLLLLLFQPIVGIVKNLVTD